MEYGLRRKGRCNALLCSILLIIIAMTLLAGCDSRYGSYPFQRESMWISQNPSFTVIYTEAENGVTEQTSILEWNNSAIQVEICFHVKVYDIYPKGVTAYDNRLFGGTWEYRDGNLVLYIEEDYIFGNQYSEIVLSPSD